MPNIRHEMLIGALSEKIYDAITSQAGLSAWWTPDTKAEPTINSVARFGFGGGYFKEMKITELKPFLMVKWICVAGVNEWMETTISFELQPGGVENLLNSHPELEDQIRQQRGSNAATLVVFHHDGWRDYTSMFAECNYTWAQFLRSLKLLCETGKGRPWPNQHGTHL